MPVEANERAHGGSSKNERQHDSRTLRLENVRGIRIGERLLPSPQLQADIGRMAGRAFLPGVGEEKFQLDDETLLRQLCAGYMPFKITGDGYEPQPLVLQAEVARFPYSINGNLSFQEFAVRMTPETGRVAEIAMNEDHSLAIGSQVITPDSLRMDIARVHFELYFAAPTDKALPPLTHRKGFKASTIVPEEGP